MENVENDNGKGLNNKKGKFLKENRDENRMSKGKTCGRISYNKCVVKMFDVNIKKFKLVLMLHLRKTQHGQQPFNDGLKLSK